MLEVYQGGRMEYTYKRMVNFHCYGLEGIFPVISIFQSDIFCASESEFVPGKDDQTTSQAGDFLLLLLSNDIRTIH